MGPFSVRFLLAYGLFEIPSAWYGDRLAPKVCSARSRMVLSHGF